MQTSFGYEDPQGVIAVVRRTEPSIEELLHKEKNPCFFLLENLQDPGNLGTIVRTAEGAGVTGIIMNRRLWIFIIRR